MKKISIILMVLLILIVVCFTKKGPTDVIKHNYTYKGENEFWDAELNEKGTITFTEKDGILNSESVSNSVLTITYKKELSDLAFVKHLEISYEGSLSSNIWASDYSEDGRITSKTFTLSDVGSNYIENEIIKVTVTIDSNVQSIELINENAN